MALQLCSSSFHSLDFNLLRRSPAAFPSYQLHYSLRPGPQDFQEKEHLLLSCRSRSDDEEYLLDAPVSAGDGFSFSGGKYSDEPSPADEWFKKGNMVKAHPVGGSGEKAKDPIFGLTMGSGSQASSDLLRWFCVESGNAENHPIVFIHGFPSQAYSYRKVLDILATKYHAIAFDWIGFGFSDKPQPKYGFDYTLDGTCILNMRILQTCLYTVINLLEKCGLMISTQKGKMTVLCGQMVAEYVASLESLINEITNSKATLVVQGYFAPVVVKYAGSHQEKIANLILLNPPITAKHANLPSTLSIFSNFLLGEIFSQDPLRASDKALISCGPYKIKEDVAMVYRRPYLTSGSAGFALNAISRAMKKELKAYVENMRTMLKDQNWKIKTTICWGERDRWLNYDGVEDFCQESKHKLIKIPAAGHHVQEDSGEELAQLITQVVGSRSYI